MDSFKATSSKYGFSITLIALGLFLTFYTIAQFNAVTQITINKRNKAFLEKYVSNQALINNPQTKSALDSYYQKNNPNESIASYAEFISKVKGDPETANPVADILKPIAGETIEIIRPEFPTLWTVYGAITILIAGIIVFLFAHGTINLKSQTAILILLAIASVSLIYMDYSSIKRDVDFQKMMNNRKDAVANRLLDIQAAQKKYKQLKGNYATSMDSLVDFIKNEKQPELKKTPLKVLPKELDTLSESSQVALGYLRIDTTYITMTELLYTNDVRMKKRNYRPFNLDSLRYIPFYKTKDGNLSEWAFSHDTLQVDDVKKIAFVISDREQWIGKTELDTLTLRIGSLDEATANGNWSK